jgi:heme exporter protein B
MNRVGFFASARLVALKDLRLEWRTLETLSTSLVFSLTVLVVFNFAFGIEAIKDLGVWRLVPGVIWIVLAFAAVVGISRSSQQERERDTLGALLLAPIDRGAIYLGKWFANLVKLTALELIVVPLSALFFDFDLIGVALPMLGVVFLHSAGITGLGTLFSTIASRIGRGEALVATLLFPASTPLFISAVKCTAALLEHGDLGTARNWLALTAGFDILYLMLALLTFEFVLEE